MMRSISAPDTRLGALQRGRGFAARRILDEPPTVKVIGEVLSCVIEDHRWDRQVESRARYYAEMMVHLEAPVAPLVEHIRGMPRESDTTDAWLAVSVIKDLRMLGHDRAVGAAAELEHMGWIEDEDESALHLAPPRLLDASRSTTKLLEQAQPRDRQVLLDLLATRTGPEDRAALVEATRSGNPRAELLAWETLGRLGDEQLVERAVELLSAHARDAQLHHRQRRRRLGPRRYLAQMPPELVLPLARRWFGEPRPLNLVAEDILEHWATSDDAPAVEQALRVAWSKRDMYRLCNCMEILTAIQHWPAVDLVLTIDEAVEYAYARQRSTRFLIGADTHEARSRLEDALWDCEDDTVLLGIEYGRHSAATTARIPELATSAVHGADIQVSARAFGPRLPLQ